MSSEHLQDKFPLRRVALYGGGRWSRVLLPVLRSLLIDEAEIVWVTDHGSERALNWLTEKQIERVAVCSYDAINRELDRTASLDSSASERIQCAIIATSPRQHASQIRQLIDLRIPAFCEKPLTLDAEQASALQQYASRVECPLGVNLEMHFASFIEDFATLCDREFKSSRGIQHIDLTWTDPWSDVRYGEVKIGDVYTSIVDDMWPHCWSLLRRIHPSGRVNAIDEIRYNPADGLVHITVRFAESVSRITLGRRADRRVRQVSVNNGEAILDFSTEPGSTETNGNRTSNHWRGARPLARSLSSFFRVVQEPNLDSAWPLSAAACVDSVKSSQAIASRLRSEQQSQLGLIAAEGIDLSNASHRNLIVDLLLPEYAAKERRWPVVTESQQIEFVKHVCKVQHWRCK